MDKDEVLVASEELNAPDFVNFLGLDGDHDKWKLHGRRALKVENGQGIGLVIEQ